MESKNKGWIAWVIQAVIAAAIAWGAAVARGLNADANAAWICRYLCDGLFVSGVMFTGFGLLLWVSGTGFFDIFSYALSSTLVLFSLLRRPEEHKHFFEYKMEKEAKREGKGWPRSVLVIGLICLALSIALMMIYYHLGGE